MKLNKVYKVLWANLKGVEFKKFVMASNENEAIEITKECYPMARIVKVEEL